MACLIQIRYLQQEEILLDNYQTVKLVIRREGRSSWGNSRMSKVPSLGPIIWEHSIPYISDLELWIICKRTLIAKDLWNDPNLRFYG
jgi:hypothetical protein